MTKTILFLTPQLPYPPHQGTTLRNYGLIKGLTERGYQVSLISFLESDQLPADQTPLADICEAVITIPVPERSGSRRLKELLTGHTDMARRLWSAPFEGALENLLRSQSFDVIHIEGIEMAGYLPIVKSITPASQTIYDAHNAEYALQRRIFQQDIRNPKRWHAAIYSAIQTRRLSRFEGETCRIVDHVFACSDTDAGLLQDLIHSLSLPLRLRGGGRGVGSDNTSVTVIPNGILIETYQEPVTPADLPQPTLVFTGKMDFRPNVDAAIWFADDILPLVQIRFPDAHFAIVGKNPHARLDRLRERDDITITGFVEEIQPYIQAADVYVAPLRMGSGTRFKLLEAMAMHRGIVSTQIGAEGLEVEAGTHLLLGDTPAQFAEEVIVLLKDVDRRETIGEAASRRVKERYDWSAIIPDVEAAYR